MVERLNPGLERIASARSAAGDSGILYDAARPALIAGRGSGMRTGSSTIVLVLSANECAVFDLDLPVDLLPRVEPDGVLLQRQHRGRNL